MQHATSENSGTVKNPELLTQPTKHSNSKKVVQLPSSYHDVPHLVLLLCEPFAPPITGRMLSPLASTYVNEKEQEWLQHMRGFYFRDKLEMMEDKLVS